MAYNSENTFVAMIDSNGMIRDMSTGRRGEIIGVDYQKEDEYKRTIAEMQETLDNYYSKLVELGVIAIPKSPEIIAQEAAAEQLRLTQEQATQQAKINEAILGAIENLNAEMKELKTNGRSGNDVKFGTKQSEHDSQSDRAPGKPSKSSSDTRAKNAPGNP